mmetsp:Transcript_2387/g.4591  ORF Transcript_2387/g.4591 Transcript_2387/m.4591 type:complete len:654 (-) Transcript_2387:356-2317(-)
MDGQAAAVRCFAIARFKRPEKKGKANFTGDAQTGIVKSADGNETSFNKVYPADSKAWPLYTESLQSHITRTLEGRNVCLCVVGTSTSGIDDLVFGGNSDKGVIKEATSSIYAMIESSNRDFCCSLSVCHVSSDIVVDLLCPSEEKGLEVVPARKGYSVSNQSFLVVRNEGELLTFIDQGLKVHRELLKQSQVNVRPQMVIDFKVESQPKGNHVDKINSGGLRICLIESGKTALAVDNGLRSLQTVVQSLAVGNDAATSVPYASSSLTKIMSQNLGGNSETVFIAALDSQGNKENTSQVISLVSSGSKVTNHPANNKSMVTSEILILRKEIRAARGKMQLGNPGLFLNDIDKRDLEAFQTKLAQLEKLKESTWEAKRQKSIEWRAKRKQNLKSMAMLHILQEKVQIHAKLQQQFNELKFDIAECLNKIQTYETQIQKEIKKQQKLSDDEEAVKISKEKQTRYTEQQLTQKRAYDKLSDKFRRVMVNVVQAEENKRKTFMMSAEKLHVHQANIEHNLLRINHESFDINSIKSLNNQKMAALQEAADDGEKVHQLIKDKFEAERKATLRKWERDKLREVLVENKFRYEIYMQRNELHMLDVFKQYREHFEDQKREIENRYRKMLKESIQDAVHLQRENLKLQAQLSHLQKSIPSYN